MSATHLQEFAQIKELITKSHNVAIISHKSPDSDTVGASLALKLGLKSVGKNAESFAKDSIPANLQFLPEAATIKNTINPSLFDIIFAIDCGAAYMMKFEKDHPEILNPSKTILVNIDHHPSNENFGTINIVDTSSAATVSIIYFLLEHLGIQITRDIATCLLNGLYGDTGSFKHSNTDSLTLKIASNLIAKGADYKAIVKNQFHSNEINQLKLWGRVLSRARLNDKNATVSAVTENDFDDLSASPEDLSGIIDYLNSVPESRFAILLAEDRKGNIKGSFRTQDDMMDLSQLAGIFGGGGHKKAAGFTIPGKLIQEVVWKIKRSD